MAVLSHVCGWVEVVNYTAGQHEVTAPEVRKYTWLPESARKQGKGQRTRGQDGGTDGKGVSGRSIVYS